MEIYLEHENMGLLARWGWVFLSNGINFGVGRYKIVHFRAFNNICSDPQEIEEECFISQLRKESEVSFCMRFFPAKPLCGLQRARLSEYTSAVD